MLFQGTPEWPYSDQCAIQRLQWTDVKCCSGFPSSLKGDCPTDRSSSIRHARDSEIDGRSISLTSSNRPSSDGDDDATSSTVRQARKDEAATFTSVLERKDGEDACIGKVKPNGDGGENPRDHARCFIEQVTVPSEPTTMAASKEELLGWQEEKRQWIRASGVNTPAELERRIADMCRPSGHNEAELWKLTAHVTEVKSFLLHLHEMDKFITKRKRRCDRPPPRRRKRSRRGCRFGDCCCAVSNCHESSTERVTEQGGGPLLDPEIMNSFRFLIKSSV